MTTDYDDETWTLLSVANYVKQNIVGLFLLVLAFFIVYVVDHIAMYNAIIFSPLPQIPGVFTPPVPTYPRSQQKRPRRR